MNALDRASGVNYQAIRDFLRRKRALTLTSADKLASLLVVKLVCEVKGGDRESMPATRPLTDGLLSAIAESGIGQRALARASGVSFSVLAKFIRSQCGLKTTSADKLGDFLGLKVIRGVKSPGPESRIDPSQPLTDAILSAIAESGLTVNALDRATGVNRHAIRDFLRRKATLTLSSADKLGDFLAVKVIRGVKPSGSEDPTDHPAKSLTDAILSAIAERGPGRVFALARQANVHHRSLRQFVRREVDLKLTTADRLIIVLALGVVRDANVRHPVPRPPIINPLQPLSDAILSAIVERGIGICPLARAAGVAENTIRDLVRGRRVLTLGPSIKLANALGLELEPAKILTRSEATLSPPAGPISGTTVSTIKKDASIDRVRPLFQARPPAGPERGPDEDGRSREPGPWDDWDASKCPGRVREDGNLVVFGRDKGPLSRSARMLFEAMQAKYPGGFTLNDLTKHQLVGDPRGIIDRWRKKDADCRAAIQVPLVRKGGFYRFGRPNE